MNTKFSTMIASLLMVSALSATAIADNKVDLMEGKGAAQTQEKGMPDKAMQEKAAPEADQAKQEPKPVAQKAPAHKKAHKAKHKKTAKKHHVKHKKVTKHKAKAKAAKTSAKPAAKPAK